jgi:hypothetical protein
MACCGVEEGEEDRRLFDQAAGQALITGETVTCSFLGGRYMFKR